MSEPANELGPSCCSSSLGEAPAVQDAASDVKEGEVGLRLAQPHRHKPLPIIEELHFVRGGLELASPCPRPTAARQKLKRTANIFVVLEHNNNNEAKVAVDMEKNRLWFWFSFVITGSNGKWPSSGCSVNKKALHDM